MADECSLPPVEPDEKAKCDWCGEPAFVTRYNLPIEEAMARRAKGIEVHPCGRWCRDCYFKQLVGPRPTS